MKPPAFAYHRPRSLAEALSTLADVDGDGKVLAGGQSLVPLLNMRLAAPGHLVDINGLGAELGSIEADEAGARVGALVRHAETERAQAVPSLVREATRHVAHPTIRNRGTTVGSIAHADPASELPAVLLLLGGSVTAASTTGERTIAAADLFVGPLETSLRSGELVTSALFPALPARSGSAWVEVSRRSGDYALAGLGLVVTLTPQREIERAVAAFISVGPTPVMVDLTPAVGGQPAADADWAAAGDLARAQMDPDADIHATADYRRHLVGVLTARAGAVAARRAEEVA